MIAVYRNRQKHNSQTPLLKAAVMQRDDRGHKPRITTPISDNSEADNLRIFDHRRG
jgi:hypothetical protein